MTTAGGRTRSQRRSPLLSPLPWCYRPQPTGECQSAPGDWCVWVPLWFPAGATAPPRSPDASSLLTPSNRDNASPTGEEDRLLLVDQQVKAGQAEAPSCQELEPGLGRQAGHGLPGLVVGIEGALQDV